jgi:hypothetical protein
MASSSLNLSGGVMATFKTEAEGELSIERIAPRKTEEDLRDERTQKFMRLLEGSNVGEKPEIFDTQGVQAALGKPDHLLDREAAITFKQGFERLMAREASK